MISDIMKILPTVYVHNGNWTEWSAIWSEVQFEITSMISDQNSTTQSSNTTLLQPFWNRRIQSVSIFIWPSRNKEAFLPKSRNKKAFSSHLKIFVPKTEMMQYRAKGCDLIRHDVSLYVENEWRDLEQRWFRTKNSVIRE